MYSSDKVFQSWIESLTNFFSGLSTSPFSKTLSNFKDSELGDSLSMSSTNLSCEGDTVWLDDDPTQVDISPKSSI